MDFSGEMHRAFSVHGIPAGRIRGTEKLRLKPYIHQRLFRGETNHVFRRLPGRPARRAPQDMNRDDSSILFLCRDLGRTKEVPIRSQTYLPGKTASGGWSVGPFDAEFFTGGHNRYFFIATHDRKVVGQVRVYHKIQDKVRVNL